jgi:hypothetical protein
LGSGKHIKRSIEKYGKENFHREILCFTETYSEAFEIEELIVDQDFLDSPTTYNMKLGGRGGFDHIELTPEESQKRASVGGSRASAMGLGIHDPKYTEDRILWSKRSIESQRITGTGMFDPINRALGCNAALTETAREKRKETFSEILHQQGERNSQFGTMWIYNLENFESMKINKTDTIPDGFAKGRKLKPKQAS